MTIEQYISLEEAADRLNMGEDDIQGLVESGRIRGAKLPDGSVAVSEKSVVKREPTMSSIPKEELPEYKKHAHLQGMGLGIREAARKHYIPQSTVGRWVQLGYIDRIGTSGKKQLIDEADVAYCAEVYRRRGSQGKWLFRQEGTPYQPKSRRGNIVRYLF